MSTSSAPTTTIIEEFRAAAGRIVGRDQVGDGPPEHCIDGLQPDAEASPATPAEVAAVLDEARACRLSVVPVGSGTQLTLGNVPEAYDIALSTRRLNSLVEYEPDDLTVTVEAGHDFASLAAALRERGQWLPIDRSGPTATVGGMIASNVFGPLRHAHGTIRDWLIGIEVAHADGGRTKAGGRVVKNVAGYDMTKLHIGALGSLGVITQVTFKLAPIPPIEQSLTISCDTAAQAAACAAEMRHRGLAVLRCDLLSPPAAYALLGGPHWSLCITLAGTAAAVARSEREVAAIAKAGDCHVRVIDDARHWEEWRATLNAGTLRLRAGVRSAQVAETIAVLDRRFVGAAPRLSATPSAGVIRASLQPTHGMRAQTLLDSARDVIARRGGVLVVEHAPLSLKQQIDVFGPLRGDFPIMKRLRAEFDAHRTLSPGRFVGRL
jgi:glycolate oxidase FAD binding subunit